MRILDDFSPLVEVVGLDEAYRRRDQGDCWVMERQSQAIRTRTCEELGLVVSVGAPESLVAKIASDPRNSTPLQDQRGSPIASRRSRSSECEDSVPGRWTGSAKGSGPSVTSSVRLPTSWPRDSVIPRDASTS